MEIKYKKEEIMFFLSSLLSTFAQLVKYVACLMEIKIQKRRNSGFSQLHVVNIYTTCEVCCSLNGNQHTKKEEIPGFFSAPCCQHLHN